MRIVTLEEHISFPEMVQQIPKEKLGGHDMSPMMQQIAPKLADIEGERLKSMDKSGVSTQVVSVINTGANLLSPENGPAFAKQYNDLIAKKISGHVGRFAAFANLPTTNPEAAAEELERAVSELNFCGAMINGLTEDKFLDDPFFAPILQKAEELDVPIYLHPGLPPQAVIDAYYTGLPKNAGMLLSIADWGWHSETALHILRLITSGTLDKFPKLKLIIGHMGEMLPMMMARCDNAFKPGGNGANERGIVQTLKEQVHITTSGLFTQPPLKIAIDTFGIDNIMFSVDYPFSTNEQGKKFLDEMELPNEDKEKIAYVNADRILHLHH